MATNQGLMGAAALYRFHRDVSSRGCFFALRTARIPAAIADHALFGRIQSQLMLTYEDMSLFYKLFLAIPWELKQGSRGAVFLSVGIVNFLEYLDVPNTPYAAALMSIIDVGNSGRLSYLDMVVCVWNACTLSEHAQYSFLWEIISVYAKKTFKGAKLLSNITSTLKRVIGCELTSSTIEFIAEALKKAPDCELNYERFYYLVSRDACVKEQLDKYTEDIKIHVGTRVWWRLAAEKRRIIAFEQPWKDVVQQLTGNMPTKNGSFLSWTGVLPTAVNDTHGFDVLVRAELLATGVSIQDVQSGNVAVVLPRAYVLKQVQATCAEHHDHDRINAIRETHGLAPLPPLKGKQLVGTNVLQLKHIPLKQVTVDGCGKKVFVAPGVIPGQQKVWTHEFRDKREFWFLSKSSKENNGDLGTEGKSYTLQTVERVVELTKDDCDDQDSGDERHGAQQPAMLSSLKYSTPVGDRQIDVTKANAADEDWYPKPKPSRNRWYKLSDKTTERFQKPVPWQLF